MEYQLALAPELEVSPADFVSTWNALDEAKDVAQARLSQATSTHYDPLLLGTIAVLGSVGVGVATNAIYDLIKRVVVKQKGHKHVRITQIDQPDGTHILVIESQEE